jgi:hypothetical protein
VAFLVAVVEAVFRLLQWVHAPYYALFFVGPAAVLVEIAAMRQRQSKVLTGDQEIRRVSQEIKRSGAGG